MDGPEIEATIITGPRRLLQLGDGEPITFEDPVLGPKVVGVDKEFALGFILTRKTVEDDKYNKANQASMWLAHATQMTYEFRSGALLDDAFTGTDFKGIDNLALCHIAHTIINSPSAATYANRPTTEVGFSMAGISALLNLSELIVDHNGDPIPTKPNTVIYNPSQIKKAMQIFEQGKEPFTAGNEINAEAKRVAGIRHIVKRYVTNNTSYFLMDSALNDAHFLLRRKSDFDSTDDFDTKAAKFSTTTRFLIWFVDPRGWTGANPT